MSRIFKITAFLLAALCLLSLFGGCAKKTTDAPASPQSPSEAPTPSKGSGEAISSLTGEPSAPTPSEEQSSPSLPATNELLTFSLENAAGSASREITIPLRIENNAGIAGYSLTVTYDPQVLSFISCQNKVPDGYAATNSVATPGQVRVMCTVMGGNKITLNDVCDLLTFRIQSDANVGSYQIGLIIADAKDSVYTVEQDGSMPNVDCSLAGATLTVHC